MINNTHIIILEKGLNERYKYLIDKYHLTPHYFNLDNTITLINKYLTKNVLKNTIENFITYAKTNDIRTVYLSNAEGYIAHNTIILIKEKIPNIKIIALQHGLFPFKIKYKLIRKLFNYFTKIFLDIFFYGVGFGGILNIDKYLVYATPYKNYLLQNGWEENNVIIAPEILKAEFFDNRKTTINNNSKSALFLPQGLSISGLISKNEEKIINKNVIKYLAKNYEKVIIKMHPLCLDNVSGIMLDNCVIYDNLLESFEESDIAYSFFSTSLLDAQIFGLKTISIILTSSKIDKNLYKIFPKTISYSQIINN